MDADEFRKYGKQAIDFIADYMENIRERPVLPAVEPGYFQKLLPDSAPENGESFSDVFGEIDRLIMPGVCCLGVLWGFEFIFVLDYALAFAAVSCLLSGWEFVSFDYWGDSRRWNWSYWFQLGNSFYMKFFFQVILNLRRLQVRF